MLCNLTSGSYFDILLSCRSRKVQKCLGQVLRETFCNIGGRGHYNKNQLGKTASRGALLSHRHSLASTRPPTCEQTPDPGYNSKRGQKRLERDRSLSCPNINPEFDDQDQDPESDHSDHDQQQEDHKLDQQYLEPMRTRKQSIYQHTTSTEVPSVVVYTASNLDVYNAVIYEEDGELMPPDEDALSQRRLSASLPYGLDKILSSRQNSKTNDNDNDSSLDGGEVDATLSPEITQPPSTFVKHHELCSSNSPPHLPLESLV